MIRFYFLEFNRIFLFFPRCGRFFPFAVRLLSFFPERAESPRQQHTRAFSRTFLPSIVTFIHNCQCCKNCCKSITRQPAMLSRHCFFVSSTTALAHLFEQYSPPPLLPPHFIFTFLMLQFVGEIWVLVHMLLASVKSSPG